MLRFLGRPLLLPFGHQTTVGCAQDAACATLVAGTQLQVVHPLHIAVLHLFQKIGNILDVVDGQVPSGGEVVNLSAGHGPHQAAARNGMEVKLVVPQLVLALLDDAEHFVIKVIHVDHPIVLRLFLPHRTLDGGDFGGTGRHIEDADILRRNALVHQIAADVERGQVHGRTDQQQVGQQRRELHLDQPDNGRAEGGDQRSLRLRIGQPLPDHLVEDVHALFNLIDVFEPQMVNGGQDGPLGYLFRKLRTEGGGHQDDRALVVVDGLEIILLDVDGVHRTGQVAASAVHAAVGLQPRMPLLHMDGACRTDTGAVRAADAQIRLELQGMMKTLLHAYAFLGTK